MGPRRLIFHQSSLDDGVKWEWVGREWMQWVQKEGEVNEEDQEGWMVSSMNCVVKRA